MLRAWTQASLLAFQLAKVYNLALPPARMKDQKRFLEKNSMLVKEFDRYVLEHPEFADQFPNNALVVMQIDGDEEFNDWARETAHRAAEKDTPIVLYFAVTELKPVRSRIEKLKLELVA